MEDNMTKIYKITNKINGKPYIGQTGRIIKKRINEHKKKSSNIPLKNAIKKYGWDNFNFEVVDEVSEAIADCIESFLIQYCDSMIDKNGYNLETGGNKYKHASEYTRKKLSNALKGKICSEETKKKLSESLTGKHHSEETKKKMSKAQKGRHHSEESKIKMKKNSYWKGKTLSTEICRKMSESRKGKTSPRKGIKFSEEHRKKLSEAKIGKPWSEVRRLAQKK